MGVNWGEGMDTYFRKYGIIWGSRVQSLPQACLLIANWFASGQLGFF